MEGGQTAKATEAINIKAPFQFSACLNHRFAIVDKLHGAGTAATEVVQNYLFKSGILVVPYENYNY